MSNKIYIYLAKRDKRGIKILSCFKNTNSYFPTRIIDLKQLNLPDKMFNSIEKEIKDNRMMYEPWIQSSKSFNDFRQSLIKRGYSNIPLQQSVAYVAKEPEERKISNKFTSEKKSMLRRGSIKRQGS